MNFTEAVKLIDRQRQDVIDMRVNPKLYYDVLQTIKDAHPAAVTKDVHEYVEQEWNNMFSEWTP